MMLGEVYLYFMLLAAIAACAFWFQKKISKLLYWVAPFLFIVFFVELIADWMSYKYGSNVLLYNIFTIFDSSFYFLLLREAIISKKMKQFLIIAVCLFPLFVIFNIFLLRPPSEQFVSMSYALATLIIVFSAIFYFYELFRSDKYIDLARDPFFWICSGLLFYYSCGFPLFALNNFLSSSSNIFIKNYGSIISLLNILLYSSFIIASLCRVRIRNSSF